MCIRDRLRKELVKYQKQIKFLGITFDEKLTFEEHINEVYEKCQKRLNLLKSLSGKTWGASPDIIMYTYRTFIRPLIEYGCVLFAHSNTKLLNKLQAIETTAIKIAFDLPPWTKNFWCYQQVKFTPILERIKMQAKAFVSKNKQDYVLKPFIENCKPSTNGNHSPIYKAMNWCDSK